MVQGLLCLTLKSFLTREFIHHIVFARNDLILMSLRFLKIFLYKSTLDCKWFMCTLIKVLYFIRTIIKVHICIVYLIVFIQWLVNKLLQKESKWHSYLSIIEITNWHHNQSHFIIQSRHTIPFSAIINIKQFLHWCKKNIFFHFMYLK